MKLKRSLFVAAIIIITLATSCSSMKDCNGVKHQRLANGVRI